MTRTHSQAVHFCGISRSSFVGVASNLTPSINSSQDSLHFSTNHYISSGAKRRYSEQLVTPFDRYSLRTFAAAVDPTTNLSVRIARLAVTSPLNSFEVRSHDADTTGPAPFLVLRSLKAMIKRSTISQMFTISLVIFNWFLTIGMIYTTGLVMFGMIEPNSAVALMPFSMMLAIPAVRSLYADLPCLATSFGALRIRQPISISSNSFYAQTRRASSCKCYS